MFFLFLKKLIKPKNWFALLFFIANGFFSAFLFDLLVEGIFNSQLETTQIYLIGGGLYLLCVIACTSTLGEWIMRTFFMPKMVRADKHPQAERLMSIFNEVHDRAEAKTPMLNNHVKLYVALDNTLNACALGKKTLVINEGLLALDDEHIKGILAHEFAHLANGDTLFSLALVGGNFMFTAVVTMFKLLILLINFVICLIARREETLIGIVLMIAVNFLISLWTIIGNFLINLTSRSEEYGADHYAGELGYAKELRDALDIMDQMDGRFHMTFIQAINSSHPRTDKRIIRLEEDFGLQSLGLQNLPV